MCERKQKCFGLDKHSETLKQINSRTTLICILGKYTKPQSENLK
jgi:hypothetical protein